MPKTFKDCFFVYVLTGFLLPSFYFLRDPFLSNLLENSTYFPLHLFSLFMFPQKILSVDVIILHFKNTDIS